MTQTTKAWYVSSLMTPDSLDKNEAYKNALHRKEFDDLVAAVSKALRDVEFHRISPNAAIVYRKDDIFALGEIGYKNTKTNGNGDATYYVRSRRIENPKYRDSSWQHRIVSTKVLKNAVTAASTYLVPYTCEESVDATDDAARQIINDSVAQHHSAARAAFKDLTGEAGYSSNMSSDFMRELRDHRFISPKLNDASVKFYATYDAWKDAESAAKSGVFYVGVSGNYPQQFADTARVQISYPYKADGFDRMHSDALPDWVKGRVGVLSMVEPMRYVQGVGLRLDDRIFYVVRGSEEVA